MSNSYRDYKVGFIDNLPVGITYNPAIGRFYVNEGLDSEKRFYSPVKAERYLDYIVHSPVFLPVLIFHVL